MPSTFTEFELDILKELINVGGGNVATSISNLFGKRVDMEVPIIQQMSYDDVFGEIMSAETVVKAVQIQTTDDLKGQFLYVLHEDGILEVAQEKFKHYPQTAEIADSAVCELANILVNSFLNAITQFLDLKAHSSVPYMAEDMFGSLLCSAYLEELQYDDKIWIFKNNFWVEENKWASSLYFVPQDGVFENLIATIN